MVHGDAPFRQQLLYVAEGPYLRYHRIATRITSGGNRNRQS
jgi:hypothetical protein